MLSTSVWLRTVDQVAIEEQDRSRFHFAIDQIEVRLCEVNSVFFDPELRSYFERG